jgi:curved DNA-binding protein
MPVKYVDYYSKLEIDKNATQKDIQAAYRRLARKYHPDVNKEKDAEDKFKLINEAYEVLKDPEKRQKYDQLGPNWDKNANFNGSPWGFQGENVQGFSSGDFSDFFESLFGSAYSGQRAGANPFHQNRETQVEIEIDIAEAFTEANKKIQLSNSNNQDVRSVEFKIPRGVKNETKIRLRGQGELTSSGNRGDLLIKLVFKPHSRYEVIDYDIYLKLNISPWLATLGGKVSIETLDTKKLEINLPAGIQPGQKLRIKGKGLPKKEGYGDLYVISTVKIPKHLSKEQTELVEKLASFDKNTTGHHKEGESHG